MTGGHQQGAAVLHVDFQDITARTTRTQDSRVAATAASSTAAAASAGATHFNTDF